MATIDRLENIIKTLRAMCFEYDCCTDECAHYHGEVEYQCENLDDIVEELRQKIVVEQGRRALCLWCGESFYHSVGHHCTELVLLGDK